MAARADTPDPNDRVTRTDGVADSDQVTHTDREVDDIVAGRNDAVTDDRVVEREVVVERDEHPVVADTDTLDHGQHVDPDAEVVADRAVREEIVAREKERFGGMKFGSAFFGWLTAAGTAVLLTTAVSALSVAIGLRLLDGEEIDSGEAQVLGIAGIITIAAILFVAYLAGGYVAGRMARFSGAKQGVAVWLWSIVIAVVAAIIGLARRLTVRHPRAAQRAAATAAGTGRPHRVRNRDRDPGAADLAGRSRARRARGDAVPPAGGSGGVGAGADGLAPRGEQGWMAPRLLSWASATLERWCATLISADAIRPGPWRDRRPTCRRLGCRDVLVPCCLADEPDAPALGLRTADAALGSRIDEILASG